MNSLAFLQIPITVGVRDTDFKSEMKISSILRHFQEAASLHVDKLGIGISDMQANNQIAWVLAKIRIEIKRYPKLKEKLTIETWPQLPGTIEYQRDFIVKDENGDTIIKALSSWIIINTDTREIQRSNLVSLSHLAIYTERPLGNLLSRFKPVKVVRECYQRTVRYSDIDLMGHLNNAKYLDFVLDCFSVYDHKKFTIKSIELSFASEALPGETISMRTTKLPSNNENKVYIEGLKSNDQQIAFKSIVTRSE